MGSGVWMYLKSTCEGEMNRLGSEGWELVAVTAQGGQECFYYKKPVATMSEIITLEQLVRAEKRRPGG